MPVPAPTHPSAPARPAAATARPASAASTCTTRESFSHESSHSPTTGSTTPSTPDRGIGRKRGRDRAVEDPSDLHRGGQVDRRLDRAPLADLQVARQLAGAVEDRARRPGRAPEERRGIGGHDRGDARARDAAPLGWLGLVAAHGDVTDEDAGNVGDRVLRAGRPRPIRIPWSRSRGPAVAAASARRRA